MSIKIIREGNLVTNDLPARIDSFLQDFAQMYGEISYNDIMNLGKAWNTIDQANKTTLNKLIKTIKRSMKDYAGDLYELAEEDPDIKKACGDLVKKVKSFKSESLHEDASRDNYRVFTLVMDVAFPKDKSPRDYGVDDPYKSQLYNAICKALDSLGLEMAGDFISNEGESTTNYSNSGYEFFD